MTDLSSLAGKRILLIVGGGIAAYKALELARLFGKAGSTVCGVMTAGAQQFVTPLSLGGVTGQQVFTELFSLTDEAEMGHIQLSRDADLVVVAPATASLMARMAQGMADDLATTLLLATDKRILLAPAMNLRMWLHPATQRNLARLREDGVAVVGPDDGSMACGEWGPGRLAEPPAILDAAAAALRADTRMPLPPGITGRPPSGAAAPRSLAGRRVVVTSGPTVEPIDPVRYIANRSSGRQGHAIAAAAAAAGAEVVLVSGPVSLPDPPGVTVVKAETAREMLAAVADALPADVFVAAAAVADWRPAEAQAQKIKKSDAAAGEPVLTLVRNPDILRWVARESASRPGLVVGFAAETETLLDHARRKLEAKGCDLLVANDVGAGTAVMGGTDNTVHLVTRDGVETWPTLPKEDVAARLVERLALMLERDP